MDLYINCSVTAGVDSEDPVVWPNCLFYLSFYCSWQGSPVMGACLLAGQACSVTGESQCVFTPSPVRPSLPIAPNHQRQWRPSTTLQSLKCILNNSWLNRLKCLVSLGINSKLSMGRDHKNSQDSQSNIKVTGPSYLTIIS